MPKYPDVKVRLTGRDGNIFAIGGRVVAALKAAKVPDGERAEFLNELTASPSYDAALRTVMAWVKVR